MRDMSDLGVDYRSCFKYAGRRYAKCKGYPVSSDGYEFCPCCLADAEHQTCEVHVIQYSLDGSGDINTLLCKCNHCNCRYGYQTMEDVHYAAND